MFVIVFIVCSESQSANGTFTLNAFYFQIDYPIAIISHELTEFAFQRQQWIIIEDFPEQRTLC